MAKYNLSIVGLIAITICLILVFTERADSMPAQYDYDNLRDIYELLLRNEGLQGSNQLVHQMERKGGRQPQLRLRFGKRSDPWSMTSGDNTPEKFS
ncbi:short neuropeptide F-like [Oppia nitens]|uniref:short neuropeptide F-like n=1 Tax=Oppia nitens TaxID=1686743 RepID=UPI0023DBCE8B|nr:short neuropeptide F-like [Oppia nitens]